MYQIRFMFQLYNIFSSRIVLEGRREGAQWSGSVHCWWHSTYKGKGERKVRHSYRGISLLTKYTGEGVCLGHFG